MVNFFSFLYFPKGSTGGKFYDGKRDLESIEAFLYQSYAFSDEDV